MFDFLKPYPWSAYIITEDKKMISYWHLDSPIAFLGYIGLWYSRNGNPKSPYIIGLNYNKNHTFVALSLDSFNNDGTPKRELLEKLMEIDEKIITRRVKGKFEFDFRNPVNKKKIDRSEISELLYN